MRISQINGRPSIAIPASWTAAALVAASVLVTGLSGCTEARDDGTVPVSGRVTLDGKPLEAVQISFWADEHQFGGVSGSNGRYELKPGAVPGPYKVSIARGWGKFAAEPGGDGQPAASAGSRQPSMPLPDRYSDPKRTQLSFTVAEPGTDKADFNLRTQ